MAYLDSWAQALTREHKPSNTLQPEEPFLADDVNTDDDVLNAVFRTHGGLFAKVRPVLRVCLCPLARVPL